MMLINPFLLAKVNTLTKITHKWQVIYYLKITKKKKIHDLTYMHHTCDLFHLVFFFSLVYISFIG